MSHPISDVMQTSLENIKQMVDVDKIVGNAIKLEDGTMVVPICKVGFGFGSGGSEFGKGKKQDESLPFGGGSAAGVSLSPMAFLVIHQDKVELLSVNDRTHIYEKIMQVVQKASDKLIEEIKLNRIYSVFLWKKN